jgi:hypothetical protein
VEADILTSHQHEFNGVGALRDLLGEPQDKVYYDATHVYLNDELEVPVSESGRMTWYDARQRGRLERGVMRWEYRLYFPSTRVSDLAAEGDLLVIALRQDGTLLVLVAKAESSSAAQIAWLFGLDNTVQKSFLVKEDLESEHERIRLTGRLVLESIGISVEDEPTEDYLGVLVDRFGARFPTTREFSAFARSTLPGLDVLGDPDGTLMAWMSREELLFRTLERHLIAERLSQGFLASDSGGGVDVEGFLRFSLSVQNRRKSRVGLAFENHLEILLGQHGIRFSRTAVTENRSKPDFLFPSAEAYADAGFDASRLTMLGVKSTCKDRWRQILAEADRIPEKHLLTLEPAISRQQTDEMREKRVRLVVPFELHETYLQEQRDWLLDLREMISMVRARQEYPGFPEAESRPSRVIRPPDAPRPSHAGLLCP